MGIGFSLLKDGKIIKYEKGLNLDVRDIAKAIRKTDYDWAIFHTRYASIGEKSDKNCHPFKNGNMVLAMNGTETSVKFLSNIKEITDTEAILDIIKKYNLGITALKKLSSIFVGFRNGKPFVVADNIYNIKVLNNKRNNAIVFASDFPKSFKKNIYRPTEPFLWFNGNLPNCLEKDKQLKLRRYIGNKKLYDNYYSIDDYYYDQYYFDLDRVG